MAPARWSTLAILVWTALAGCKTDTRGTGAVAADDGGVDPVGRRPGETPAGQQAGGRAGAQGAGGTGGTARTDAAPPADPRDAGAPDERPPPPSDAAPGALAVTAADQKVYVGQTARLEATAAGGAGATFAWTVVSAPAGSAVATAAVAGATTARPSFVTDAPGEYVLRVRATAPGFDAGTRDVRVQAVEATVFFTSARVMGDRISFVMRAAGASTGAARDVGCVETGPRSLGGFQYQPGYGVDTWEGPAGTPARVTYAAARLNDGSGARVLMAATSESTCTAGPPRPLLPPLPKDQDYRQPSFSPDGARVAFVLARGGPDTDVGVVGFDGAGATMLGPMSGVDGDAPPPRPQWRDAHTVAWVRSQTATSWELLQARDAGGAAPAVVMSCTGRRPRQFALLADGSVLYARGESPENLVVVKVGDNKACAPVRALTSNTSARARARDFSVSPDGTRVLFVGIADADVDRPEVKDAAYGGFLTAVPVGGGAATALPGGRADFGAVWLAGGARIAFTRRSGAMQIATVAAPDGAMTRDLQSADVGASADNVAAVGSNGSACAYGRGGRAPLALAVVALALLPRRRRKNVRVGPPSRPA